MDRTRPAVTATIDAIAWVCLNDGKILCARSRGKDVYYIPGGKREPGETDLDTLAREIAEELTVTIILATARYLGTFRAQAHGHADGVMVRMTCYTAGYQGTPAPGNEIGELSWLTYADRDRVPPVDQIVFDRLHQAGQLG
jgi:8-oxo-dGTP diphosphatase